MISLFIDTSSNYLYTGLVQDDKLLVETKKQLDQQLSVEALPFIIQNFEKVGLRPNDMDNIIVVIGPGSFTGIRIGVTIAKTMAWSLHKKIIPVSALQVMAISSECSNYSMPVIDARRGYVFGAIYDKDCHAVIGDSYCLLSELEEKAKSYQDIKIITNSELNFSYFQEKYTPNIVRVVSFFRNYEGCNAHLVNPMYLKKTEAEEKANL